MIISMAQQQFVGVGFGVLPIWWWDSGIHRSDGLLQVVEMIDRVVTMIDLLYFWDVSGGEVDTPPLWQDRPSFLVSKIKCGDGNDIDATTNLHFP